MKKTAKLLSIVLALVMALSVIPMFASAEETNEAEDRVAGWKANYQLFIDKLLDDSKWTSWEYVYENEKALNNTYSTLTAFALYDDAWRNYATKEVSIDNAEKILLALIEKADYTFDDGYVDEITSVLETAGDVNDFLQKANKYINWDVLESQGWSTTFEIIGDAAKILNAYQNYRDQFIEAYARVLSVQMANVNYLDLLTYVRDNTENDVLAAAADKLIADIGASVESVLEGLAAQIALDGGQIGAEYLINFAMNSNAYTAVALKVYQVAASIAETLWNTGATASCIDTLLLAYDFQDLASDWTAIALDEDADKAVIAVSFLMTAREVCEDALKNYKLAASDGVVGKIKSKLYGTVFEDTELNVAALGIMRDAMFGEIEEFQPVTTALYIYCPVDVVVLTKANVAAYTITDGTILTAKNDAGMFASLYSEYAHDYIKLAFLSDNYSIKLAGKSEGAVTVKMDCLKDGVVEDWSFTDVKVDKGYSIVFKTDFTGTPVYNYSTPNQAAIKVIDFNDEYIPSEKPTVTVKEVVDATVEVGKDEAKSFADKIKEFFEKLFSWFTKLFNK